MIVYMINIYLIVVDITIAEYYPYIFAKFSVLFKAFCIYSGVYIN